MSTMINVTMIKDHGLSLSFQVDSWVDAYEKINREQVRDGQPFALAYASESEWSEALGRYRIVRSETFAMNDFGFERTLRSFGPKTRLVVYKGKPKLKDE